jgi:hypothetical protein
VSELPGILHQALDVIHFSHMWNDTIDRFHNVYRTPYIEPNPIWLEYNKAKLKSPPFILNAKARKIVEAAIREVVIFAGVSYMLSTCEPTTLIAWSTHTARPRVHF